MKEFYLLLWAQSEYKCQVGLLPLLYIASTLVNVYGLLLLVKIATALLACIRQILLTVEVSPNILLYSLLV